jgi:hypothetical protein
MTWLGYDVPAELFAALLVILYWALVMWFMVVDGAYPPEENDELYRD